MVEYRARTRSSSSPTRSPPHSNIYPLDELAQRYGIEDMMDFSLCDDPADQTIDKEFLAYTTASFGLREIGDVDILSFWQVSPHYLPCFSSRSHVLCHREMNRGSLRFLQSH
jgi:hypothetical protein